MSKLPFMSRRAVLRGAGAAAIGLPFLEAMRPRGALAADPEPPARALTLFFGLGIPKEIQAEGLTGCLEPLAPFAGKLAWLRGVHLYEADGGANNHFDGGGGVFVGREPRSDSIAGGPSIDQVLRTELYPNGLPAGMSPALVAGSFFRRSRLTRYVHSWSDDGSPVDVPIETPEALFTRVFGTPEPIDGSARAQRLRRSVLDAVVADYQRLSSAGGGLSATDRRALTEHLERIRELEQRVFSGPPEPPRPGGGCATPNAPTPLDLLGDQTPDPRGEGVDIVLDDWVRLWRNLVDVYVLAFRCDRARFGNLLFQSAGERVRLRGLHRYQGRNIYDFDDRRDRGRDGSDGCSHEFWHRYRASSDNVEMRHHIHFMMSQLAYVLEALDDPSARDGNGLTLLDNMMVMIGTELGDGNRHNLESVFHMVSGANERFQPGTHDVNVDGLDVYDTILEAYGVTRRMSPQGRNARRVEALLRP